MHGKLYETIVQYRKAGNLLKALEHARYAMTQARTSKKIKSAFAWVLYDLLKQRSKSLYQSRSSSPDSQTHTLLNDICIEYMHYQLPKKDLCYSLMLSQLTRLDPPPPCLLTFLKWGGPSGLRPEDLQQVEDKGQTYPSLLEKLVVQIIRFSLLSENEGDARFTLGLLRYTLRKSSVLNNLSHLQRSLGFLLRICQHTKHALQAHLQYINSNREDFRIWRELSLLHRQKNKKIGLSLLIRALSEADRQGISRIQQIPILEEAAILAYSLEEEQYAYLLARCALDILVQVKQKIPYDLTLFMQKLPYQWTPPQVYQNWDRLLISTRRDTEAWLGQQNIVSTSPMKILDEVIALKTKQTSINLSEIW
jgi:hypothetical protein